VTRISIYSDNKILISSWSSALSTNFQVNTIDDINDDSCPNAIIIDVKKINNDQQLFSIFSKKSTRFLVVGENWSEKNQIKALVHGAVGYCGESEPANIILQAVNCILKGDIWIQRHLVPQVIGTLVQMNTVSNDKVAEPKSDLSLERFNTLSNREKDVANMIHSGKSNKLIATSLNISERTVKAHLTSIYKKLNVNDRLHLAVFIKEFS